MSLSIELGDCKLDMGTQIDYIMDRLSDEDLEELFKEWQAKQARKEAKK
jgi:hypothetical protein